MQNFPRPYPEAINQRSSLELQTCLSALGLVLKDFGELFYLLGFLDHVEGEHFSRRGFLNFLAQLACQFVKPLDPFAEFLLVLLHASASRGGRSSRVRAHLRRVRSLRRLRRRRRSWRILSE